MCLYWGRQGAARQPLLNLILGLTGADDGRIIYNDTDITFLPMEERGFNIVFQDYALFPNLNVYKNITYGLKNKPLISSKEEVEEMIGLLGLEEHLEKKRLNSSPAVKSRGWLWPEPW